MHLLSKHTDMRCASTKCPIFVQLLFIFMYFAFFQRPKSRTDTALATNQKNLLIQPFISPSINKQKLISIFSQISTINKYMNTSQLNLLYVQFFLNFVPAL